MELFFFLLLSFFFDCELVNQTVHTALSLHLLLSLSRPRKSSVAPTYKTKKHQPRFRSSHNVVGCRRRSQPLLFVWLAVWAPQSLPDLNLPLSFTLFLSLTLSVVGFLIHRHVPKWLPLCCSICCLPLCLSFYDTTICSLSSFSLFYAKLATHFLRTVPSLKQIDRFSAFLPESVQERVCCRCSHPAVCNPALSAG